jgi:hypothetical protein
MVPIRVADPIGAISAYRFRVSRATDKEVARLTRLAEATDDALDRFLRLSGDFVISAKIRTPL